MEDFRNKLQIFCKENGFNLTDSSIDKVVFLMMKEAGVKITNIEPVNIANILDKVYSINKVLVKEYSKLNKFTSKRARIPAISDEYKYRKGTNDTIFDFMMRSSSNVSKMDLKFNIFIKNDIHRFELSVRYNLNTEGSGYIFRLSNNNRMKLKIEGNDLGIHNIVNVYGLDLKKLFEEVIDVRLLDIMESPLLENEEAILASFR